MEGGGVGAGEGWTDALGVCVAGVIDMGYPGGWGASCAVDMEGAGAIS